MPGVWFENMITDQVFEEVLDTIKPELIKEEELKKYNDFEVACIWDIKFLNQLEVMMPQIYASVQYQLRDPKCPKDVKSMLLKRMNFVEHSLGPAVDRIWRIGSKAMYEALFQR